MSNKLINFNKYQGITFADYGLDVEKNFLQAPICECDCGNKIHIILEDPEDVADFCGQMCDENDCQHCAVFAIMDTGDVLFAIRNGEDIHICGCERDDLESFELFGEVADDCDLHCYGLIMEEMSGRFMIVED